MTARWYLGIDPGKDGAGVLLDGDGACLGYWLTSELLVDGDYAPRRLLDELRACLGSRLGTPGLAVLELPGGRPGEGAGSARVTGRGQALWEMALAALDVPYVVPSPARWTRRIFVDVPVGTQGKDRGVHVALQRVPTLNLTPGRRRKPHTGLADAACLALYGLSLTNEPAAPKRRKGA